MPKITEITLQTKNKDRCNLYLDGDFAVGVSLETVMKNRLKVGMDIDKSEFLELVKENDKIEALNKAIIYVSKTLKTKKQVKTYLENKGYNEEIVWYCIDKLKEYNYINDTEYAKRYIESTSKTQGKRLIEYKLMMKGLKKADVSDAYEQSNVSSKENASEIATKYLRNKENTKENLAKAYRYLIGKGFSHEEAGYAISKFKNED